MIRPDQIESFYGQESDISVSIQHILTGNTIEVTIIIERVSSKGEFLVKYHLKYARNIASL